MKRKDVFEGVAMLLMIGTLAIQLTGGDLNIALSLLWGATIAKNVAQWNH
jgi:hypothetical protein